MTERVGVLLLNLGGPAGPDEVRPFIRDLLSEPDVNEPARREYVGTILGEVRSRPLYFIAHEANSSVLLEDTVHSSIVKDSVE